jgi:hypothetical protein
VIILCLRCNIFFVASLERAKFSETCHFEGLLVMSGQVSTTRSVIVSH